MLQCVAVCCSVLQRVANEVAASKYEMCVAVWCSKLQRVADEVALSKH